MSDGHIHRADRHAPALRFALHRPARLGWILGVLSLLQLALLWWWALSGQPEQLVLKLWVACVLWLLATGCAAHCWWHACRGSIRWDGLQWEWQTPSGKTMLLEKPAVRLDFQSILLVQARQCGSSRSVHLWLEQRDDPLHWLALRRAVYSRALGELSTS
ncbi:hypothetical protein [Diaphorobacter aerolatus]|uniref:Uncharacterized protein n=1 Tax=Diaphorobacter aerolatus TaxID=1288495 RepID=A0A7H0GI60_9BURK|nr:hypothetical protein [Diaphorobacter aerolatus]QNP47976.1 hypothetical protein H9K75_17995 [Diaphorobacter aerolatus]